MASRGGLPDRRGNKFNKYISRMTRSVFSIVRVRSGTAAAAAAAAAKEFCSSRISLRVLSKGFLLPGWLAVAHCRSDIRGFLQEKNDLNRHKKSYGYCRFDRLFIFVMNLSLTLYLPAIVI